MKHLDEAVQFLDEKRPNDPVHILGAGWNNEFYFAEEESLKGSIEDRSSPAFLRQT